MKPASRVILLATLFVAFAPPQARAQVGATDYSKATTSTQKLRGNLTLLGITTPQDLNNILILSGPDGLLVVDHPEPASAPIVKKTLDELSAQSGGNPVKFLLNTHWHFDHVGGNEFFGPDATIVAQENVRTRMMTAQKPTWSEVVIGPYPEKALPRITFESSLTIHFDSEDIEMDHYSSGHTDGDSVIYFKKANVVHVADIYYGKGSLASGADTAGIAKSLAAVRDHMNDDTLIVTGHVSALSNKADLTLYVSLFDQTTEQVRADIAAGKSKDQVIAHGLPAAWAPWFAPKPVPAPPATKDFLQGIYKSLTHTNHIGD